MSSSDSMFKNMYRIGFSEDIHPFKEGRKLYLGGVHFPNEIGLDGHSDADVVLHAVAESILGALALGDLGKHFPDNDEKYKDIRSEKLVCEVVKMMKSSGYEISNIDIQVGAAHPKLSPSIIEMRNNIASYLGTSIGNVSVKAMSYNKVGPVGKGEAICASSVVLLRRIG